VHSGGGRALTSAQVHRNMKRGNAVRDPCPLVGSPPCQKAAATHMKKKLVPIFSIPRNRSSVPRNGGVVPRSQNVPRNNFGVPGTREVSRDEQWL
jgi:hypothetical protein